MRAKSRAHFGASAAKPIGCLWQDLLADYIVRWRCVLQRRDPPGTVMADLPIEQVIQVPGFHCPGERLFAPL